MTKSHGRETLREEAERHDALEEKGVLDELPFTRLRRYAKEPSQVYAIRIPVSRLKTIRWLADRRHEQPTALLREWVLERLDEELVEAEPKYAKEAPSPYFVVARPKKKSRFSGVKGAPARKAAVKTSPRRAPASRKGH